MRVVEDITLRIKELLLNRDVLEIMCGNADFSLEAAKYAHSVLATDTTLEAYMQRNNQTLPVNLALRVIEYPATDLLNMKYDVSICCNKLTKLSCDIKMLIKEMARVTKTEGFLIFAATQKSEIEAINSLKSSIASDKVIKKVLNVYKEIDIKKYTMLILQKK